MIKLIECPRDAMQGIKEFIPTEKKAEYINQLLQVGFDTIDFGSFVSPKAIPQMKDTAELLGKLNLDNSKSKLLAIIANERGAEDACQFDEVTYLGFPFSVSETFQQRNTNSSIDESLKRVESIQAICDKHEKQLVVYLSMAFGNPYGDEWTPDIVIKWSNELYKRGIKTQALADTIGCSTPENIKLLFSHLIPALKDVEFGAHLHSTKEQAQEKITAAFESGCLRFDSAIHGFGGCPMAADSLTGNISTQDIEFYLSANNIKHELNAEKLHQCYESSLQIFNNYH
ncbi:MAG: hydroxymethylglutaryl-CoA lyase [Bacteroidia bacterium]